MDIRGVMITSFSQVGKFLKKKKKKRYFFKKLKFDQTTDKNGQDRINKVNITENRVRYNVLTLWDHLSIVISTI